MKSNHPNDLLDNLLQEWKVGAELPLRFEEQVWRRIAVEEARQHGAGWWARLRRALEMLCARPAFATACVIAFLLAGTAAGWLQGRREVARLDDTLGWRYVQSIDPFSMHSR